MEKYIYLCYTILCIMFEYDNKYRYDGFVFSVVLFIILMGIKFFLFTSTGRMLLVVLIVLAVIIAVLRWAMIDSIIAKYGVTVASKEFVVNNLTLRNDFCTVILTPGKQIVVMDNEYNVKNEKRMFNLSKSDIDLNQAWYKLCKMFDASSNLDGLSMFYNLKAEVNIVVYDRREVKEESKEVTKTNRQSINQAGSVAIAGVTAVNSGSVNTQVNTSQIQQVNSSIKIDVNKATASEIAELPGINLIGAKKIVEHRDANGLFKDVDEFIQVSGVKPHFVDKIKAMITIGQSQIISDNNMNDDDGGRIVDF